LISTKKERNQEHEKEREDRPYFDENKNYLDEDIIQIKVGMML